MSILDIEEGSIIDVKVIDILDRELYVSHDGKIGFIDTLALSDVIYKKMTERFFYIDQELTVKFKMAYKSAYDSYEFIATIKDLYPKRNPWLYPELFEVGTYHEGYIRSVVTKDSKLYGYSVGLGFGLYGLMKMDKDISIGTLVDVRVIEVIPTREKFRVELIQLTPT